MTWTLLEASVGLSVLMCQGNVNEIMRVHDVNVDLWETQNTTGLKYPIKNDSYLRITRR